MAAELDRFRSGANAGKARMFYAGETPWHEEGFKITVEQEADWDLAMSYFDIPLEKRQLFRPVDPAALTDEMAADAKQGIPVNLQMTPVKDGFYIWRPDIKKVLGTVGSHYEIVPNRDALEVLKPLVDEGVAAIETGGVLRDGADAWLMTRWDLAKFGPNAKEVLGEEILPYSTVMVNHDGRRGIQIGNTAIRIVCANTLGMAEREAESGNRINRWATIDHRPGAKVRLVEEAHRLFAGVVERYEALAGQYRLLKAKRLEEHEFKTMVLDKVVPHPADDPKFNPEAKLAGVVIERAERKRAELTRLWTAGAGHTGDHSAWEAYNAVAEALDHNKELWPSRDGCWRTASLLTGNLADLKNKTLDRLVSFALSA